MKKFLNLLGGVLACLLLSSGQHAWAQLATGDILGTVSDPSGAVVAGATVRIENTETREARTFTTKDTGNYVFSSLQPGTYVVTVTAPSFKSSKTSNVVLLASDRVRVDARLQAGAVTEEVDVTATPSALQTDSTTVGNTVTEKTLLDAPLNGRNFISLVQLQPGVNAGSTTSFGSGSNLVDRRLNSSISANGQQEIFNNNLVDGLDNNGRATGLIILRPSVEAIAEVRTDINLYNAETGRTGGAVINVITKSGTNQLHGSAYEFFRNDITDARSFFATPAVLPHKPELRQSQFGASLGAPLLRDRTFVFVDYEGFRRIDATNNVTTNTVPTAAEEATPGYLGDIINPFTRTPLANIPTAALDPTGLAYFKLFPTPNLPGTANNFLSDPAISLFVNQGDLRIDQHFSPKDTLFARYSYNGNNSFQPGFFPNAAGVGVSGTLQGVGPGQIIVHNGQLGYTHLFTPSLLVELKAGYNYFNDTTATINSGRNFNNSAPYAIPNANVCPLPICSGLATVYPIGYGVLGDSLLSPGIVTEHTTQFAGSVTYTHGRQTFKAGASLIRRNFTFEDNAYPKGIVEFLPTVVAAAGAYQPSIQHLLLGAPYVAARTLFTAEPYDRLWEPSGYFQDDWRATDHLTFNLGLRYDVFTKPNQKGNNFSNFNINTLSIVENATGGIQNSYHDFAPRLGFDANVGKGLVVRGGFGLSFFSGTTNTGLVLTNPPIGFSSGNVINVTPLSTTGVPAVVVQSTNSSSLFGSVISEPTSQPDSYVEQFNLLVQQEYKGYVFTIGYVGELGRHLTDQIPNADIPAPTGPYPGNVSQAAPAAPYAAQLPRLTTINYYGPFGASSYNSLQVAVDRRIAHGLTANFNYTLAHNLDDLIEVLDGDAQSTYGFGDLPSQIATYDYGNSDLDLKSRFAGYFNYDLPFGKRGPSFYRNAVKGFRFNGLGFWQTGSAFTVTSSVTQASGLATINLPTVTIDRPNVVGNPKGNHAIGSGGTFFNVNAFVQQPYGTAGNERRNQLFGPDLRRGDLSLFREIPIYHNVQLELRAECINFTNTPNFAKPITTLTAYGSTSGGFGQVNSTLYGYQGRQFQFAGRITF